MIGNAVFTEIQDTTLNLKVTRSVYNAAWGTEHGPNPAPVPAMQAATGLGWDCVQCSWLEGEWSLLHKVRVRRWGKMGSKGWS